MPKISPLWVRSHYGKVLHRKREYGEQGGRTLCGCHVGPDWWHVGPGLGKHPKCKRCAA